jgi:hypothetical protein
MKLADDLTADECALLTRDTEFVRQLSVGVYVSTSDDKHQQTDRCGLHVLTAQTPIGDLTWMQTDAEVNAENGPPRSRRAVESFRDALGKIQKTIDALEGSKRVLQHATQLALFPIAVEGEKVLFTTDGELVKIGRTSRAELKRLREYQTGNGRTLTILAVMRGASERKLHKMFARHHVRGEWFRMAPEIMEFIRAWQLVEAVF